MNSHVWEDDVRKEDVLAAVCVPLRGGDTSLADSAPVTVWRLFSGLGLSSSSSSRIKMIQRNLRGCSDLRMNFVQCPKCKSLIDQNVVDISSSLDSSFANSLRPGPV